MCRWGTEPAPHGGEAFLIENGSLVTEQTGDRWTILENNEFGFVATQGISEFVPTLHKKIVAFWSLAIDRTMGKAVFANGDTEGAGGINRATGTCAARQNGELARVSTPNHE